MEGVLASASPYIAVIDADLQHDERLLPLMLEALVSGTVDLAIGSRYAAGGGMVGVGGRENFRGSSTARTKRAARFWRPGVAAYKPAS